MKTLLKWSKFGKPLRHEVEKFGFRFSSYDQTMPTCLPTRLKPLPAGRRQLQKKKKRMGFVLKGASFANQ
jgi:hypothetical protein